MKRVLFVASLNPFITGGGSQATLAYLDSIIEIFGKENVDVMIADECEISVRYQNIHYIKIKIRKRAQKYFQYLISILSRFTQPLIDYVIKHKNEYTLCIINGGVVAGIAVKAINKIGIRTVVIHHNYEVEYHFDNKSTECLGGRFMFYIKKAEGSAYLNADINLFLTMQDMKTFCSAYGNTRGSNFLLGCYEMKHAQQIELSQASKEYSLAISGTMSNYQTTVGVQDFYARYFHISKQLIPDLKVLITGHAPSEHILHIQLANPVVFTIISNPENILSIVQRGSIYLCPTNIGGGLKLRAMDGLKCGLPILVHKISARGYDYYFDKPYFRVYEDEATFARGLSDILIYLNSHVGNNNEIQDDYYQFFRFANGTQRMNEALMSLDIGINPQEIYTR